LQTAEVQNFDVGSRDKRKLGTFSQPKRPTGSTFPPAERLYVTGYDQTAIPNCFTKRAVQDKSFVAVRAGFRETEGTGQD
jgi:hypothetical protein